MNSPQKVRAIASGVLFALASVAGAATINWTNVAGGYWSVAANWSPHQVPAGGDDAVITNAGAYTVTLDANPTIGSLTLGGGGQQTLDDSAGYQLTLNNPSAINANGVLALGGTLFDQGLSVSGLIRWSGGILGQANAALNIATNGTLVLLGGGTLTLGQPLGNAGTLQLISGNLQINWGYNGSLVNLPGGVLELTADDAITQYGGGPGFSNQGTIVKSGGAGASAIAVNTFNNSGTIEANTGTINLGSTTANLSAGTAFVGAGQTVLSGGTVNLNGSMVSSNLVLAGAIFNGNGEFNGLLTWTGGTLGTEAHTLTIPTNSVLVLAGAAGNTYTLGQALSVEGTLYVQSGDLQINWGYNGTLANAPGGVVDLAADSSISQYGGGPGFSNAGWLVKSGGAGVSRLAVNTFNNSGTIEANLGTINFVSSVVNLASGSAFIGAGQTLWSGGTINLNGSLISSNVVLAGATFEGAGVIEGVLTWTAGLLGTKANTLTIPTNSLLVLAGAVGNTYTLGQSLNIEGTLALQSGDLQINWGYNGALANAPGGVVDLAADSSISQYSGGPGFSNAGLLVKTGGAGTSRLAVTTFNNSGVVEVDTGTLSFVSSAVNLSTGSLFTGSGQTVWSGGSINLTGSMTCSNVLWAGAILEGNGVLNGLLTWTAGTLGTRAVTLTIATNATLVLAGVQDGTYTLGQALNVEGTLSLRSGDLQINWGYDGSLHNLPGGLVDLAGDVSITQYSGGPGFVNEGTLLKSGGTNTSTIGVNAFNNAGGSIRVDTGAISLNGLGYAQGGGSFAVNLGGTNSGQAGELTGVGGASLGGLLTVTLTNGFVPALGSTFQILSAASRGGTFAPLNIPAGLSVNYSNNGVYLTVTGAVALQPAIAVQPTNAISTYAGHALFSVAATGLTPLHYQWWYNGAALSDGGAISGSASPTLALNGLTDNNTGGYSVTITNAYGAVTSSVATLTVLNCTTPSAGLVSWWPGGGNALDIVGGNNGGLSNGVTFAAGEVGQAFDFNGASQSVVIPDATNLELTGAFTIEAWVNLASLTDDPNGSGRGIVSKVGGAAGNFGYQFAFENQALIGQFNSPGQGWPQWVVKSPTIPALATGVWMHVAFAYDQNAMLLYLNGAPIATNVIGAQPIATSGANLRISGDDNGNVMFDGLIDEVSIYSHALSANEIAAVYGAGAAGKCLGQGPAIVGEPQSQSVVLGGTATFSVAVTGLLPRTNAWQFNGVGLVDNGRILGSQSNTLIITNVQFADAGTYEVSVTNVVGGTLSAPATLTVLRKTPLVTWSNAAAITYGTALNNTQLNATANVPGTFGYNPPAGAVPETGAYLLGVVFTPDDSTNYNRVSQYVSLTVMPAQLTVTAKNAARAYGLANPAFAGTVVGLQGLDNISAVYNCAAVPASPPGGYAIVPALVDPFGRLHNYSVSLTNGALTVNAAAPPLLAGVVPATGSTNGNQMVILTGTNFETGATVSFGSAQATAVNVSSPTTLSLQTPAAPPGTVDVTIFNPDGNQASLPGAFTFGVPPTIQAQPLSQSVVLGSNVQFSVQASGEGALSYQWQFNGANLLNLRGFGGVHTPTLTISNLVSADGGSYQLVIANAYGTLVSTAAVLTVLSPPSVSAPQSVAVGVGGAASLSVTAGGSAPFGYQWYQGGNSLPGATNPVLTFVSVQATNQGAYAVVVSNLVGSVTSSPAFLTVLGYCASAQTAQALYPAGTVVPLTVQTFNCGTQSPQTNSAAVLWIYNAGTSRTIPLVTDASGSATASFTPLLGEVGVVQYAAALPGVNNPPVQGSFTLIGLGASPASLAPVLTVGYPQTNIITLSNLTSVAFSGLTVSVSGAPANVSVQASVPAALPGNGTVQATCILTASGATPNQAQLQLQVATAQGVTNVVPLNASIVQLQPQIVAVPTALHGSMVPGAQTLVTFALENVGGTDSGGLQVLLPPGAPWMSVVTAQPLASLAPGQSNLVTLALTPTNNLTLGAYAGSLVVAGPSFQSTIPFTFDAVSTQVGNLQVTAQDEFTLVSPGAPNLSNATVTVSDFLTGSNLATLVTDAAGTVLLTNLTSAYYTINVEAPNHGGFSTTLLVQPDETNKVVAFLPDNLVSYSWVVVPTTIPDNYDFVLTTTFQTQVPWPVITINPGAFNLCQFSGTTQVDLVISNNGLISAQGLQLSFGTNANWSIVPLANNLGDLGAESSVVVPVIITQLAASTSADSSIAAQLDWHVFTPTQSNYYTTPIYVYNANPNNCMISSTPVVNVSGGGGGGGGGGAGGGGGGGEAIIPPTPYVAAPSYNFAPPITGAIVDVTLQIDQHAVIARDAFKATLQINNTAGSDISDLKVTVNPVDAAGNPAADVLQVVPPTLSGLNAVDGTGTLANGASGTASWIIIPATNAAPTGPTQFAVGGTLSYMLDGQQVVIPLFAVPITVLPTPILNVDYFLEHDVYSQDPFTTQVEPSVPFGLGIRVQNAGLGLAKDFTITSAQPTIIANSNGLLIAFELIGSQAGTNQLPSPSLTMDLGAIPPGGDATGVWLMTSTLEGAFISYSATFQHVDALGATNTSLVNSVAIHEMNHIVRLTVPTDDGTPDFLVNDTTNVDALPNRVYSSAGPVFPVISLTNITVNGALSGTQSNVTITVSAPPGWVYLEFPDPGAGTMTIGKVQRSDGVTLLVGPNVWQTPERDHMLPPQPRNLVHMFDYNSTGSYTITYGPMVTPPTVTTLAGVATNAVSATLNALVNPDNGVTSVYFEWGLTTNYSNVTPDLSLDQSLDTPQDASLLLEGLQPNTTYHYQAVAGNSAGTSLGGDVTFTTPLVTPPVIAQVGYLTIAVGQALLITNQANTQVIFTGDPVNPRGSSISTNGLFRWTPTCDQGSSTNIVTLWATDVQYPSVSNHMTFLVTVGDCIELSVGSTALLSGQEACVPVNLASSSAPLDIVQFTIQYPANSVTHLTISSTNVAVGAAFPVSTSPTQTVFQVNALSGRTLRGPANLAEICFQASNPHSGYLPLALGGVQGTKTGGGSVGNSGGASGQLVVVAAEPLLQFGTVNNAALALILYGSPGSNYVLQSSADLTGNWQSNFSLTVSNIVNSIPLGGANSNPPIQFYRAYKP